MAMVSRNSQDADDKERVHPGVLSWVEELRQVSLAVSKKSSKSPSNRNQLFYILHWTPDGKGFGVTVRKGRDPESADEWWSIDRALVKAPPFVFEDDVGILRLLWAERAHDCGLRAFGLGPRHGGEVLKRMAQTGRLYPVHDFSPLLLADERPASVIWQVDGSGRQRPWFKPTPEANLVVPLQPPWYVDLDEGLLGTLNVPGNPDVIARLFTLPPLSAKEAALVAEALTELAPELPIPVENAADNLRCIDDRLVPVLRLNTLDTHGNRGWREYEASYDAGTFDVALPVFRYQDAEIKPDDAREFFTLPDGETVRVKRRGEQEQALMASLAERSLQRIPPQALHTFGSPPDNAYGLANEAAWTAFMQDSVPLLRAAG